MKQILASNFIFIHTHLKSKQAIYFDSNEFLSVLFTVLHVIRAKCVGKLHSQLSKGDVLRSNKRGFPKIQGTTRWENHPLPHWWESHTRRNVCGVFQMVLLIYIRCRFSLPQPLEWRSRWTSWVTLWPRRLTARHHCGSPECKRLDPPRRKSLSTTPASMRNAQTSRASTRKTHLR